MKYAKFQNKLLLNLDTGDEVISTLKQIAEKESIDLAIIYGVGKSSEAILGLYDQVSNRYFIEEFNEDMTIINLHGNIALINGKPYIKCCASLSKDGLVFIGGHLAKAVIEDSAEFIIDLMPDQVILNRDNFTPADLLNI